MYDIIIIGAGTAGISAYKAARKHSDNILIINDGAWDTTCARVGCMPSKILISTANRLHHALTAGDVGLNLTIEYDTSQVLQHLQGLRDKFTASIIDDVATWPEKHKISGKAYFINTTTICVNGQHYQSKSFILAVGSTPRLNEHWQQTLAQHYISSDQIFDLAQLPKKLAIIGSGAIAIELAQAFQRLGVDTTIFSRSTKIGSLSSPDLQALAHHELSKELKIHLGILPEKVYLKDKQIEIHYQKKQIRVDYLLSAIGRSSALDGLKLQNIHSTFKDIDQLPIDHATKQLADYPIFIIGDADKHSSLQHEAAHQGKLIVKNCLDYPQVHPLQNMTPLSVVFCAPEMAIVGLSYKQLIDANIAFVIGKASYEKQGRALVLGQNKGAIEIYVDKSTQKILGAEIFVEQAEHLAHLLAWSIAQQLTIHDILTKPFYHPTLEESIRTAMTHAGSQL